jgi:hypothetical protein
MLAALGGEDDRAALAELRGRLGERRLRVLVAEKPSGAE